MVLSEQFTRAVALLCVLAAGAAALSADGVTAAAPTTVKVVADPGSSAGLHFVVRSDSDGEGGDAADELAAEYSFTADSSDGVLRVSSGAPYDGTDVAESNVRFAVDGATVHVPGDLRLGTEGISVADEIAAMRRRIEELEAFVEFATRPGTVDYPAANCTRAALGADAETGEYWVSPAPGVKFVALCDMDTDGGGWMLLMRHAHSDHVGLYDVDHGFMYDGSAWTSGNGRGAVSDSEQNYVSAAWNHVRGVREMRLVDHRDASHRHTYDVTACVGAGTLSTASGRCDANPGWLVDSCGGEARCGPGLYLNQPTLTATCPLRARVYFGTAIWDNGDSEAMIGFGYNYAAGNQGSSSCSCPYSTYCGENLASTGMFTFGTELWIR